MKSAEQWIEEMWNETHYGEPSLPMKDRIKLIQADATATLQSQVEQLRGDVALWKEGCERNAGLYKDQCRVSDTRRLDLVELRTALEKCVVALESIRDFDEDSPLDDPGCIAMDALATAKPLLNKP